MILLDGSQGEGGGQVLRSALALSLVTGTPFRIENIRAGRPRPGLLRQHLTAVEAATAISGARVEGAAIGARALVFQPGRVRAGDHRFSVGTAGSTTLVLQTVLPALLTADGPSTLIIEGGTHNPASPPFDFLDRVYLPLVRRMGPEVAATLERAGFYPAGGGRMAVTVAPVAALRPIELMTRGPVRARRVRAILANLPRVIAEREIATCAQRLGWESSAYAIETRDDAAGPGNVVIAEVQSEALTEIATAFGQKGVRAEEVARQVCAQVEEYLATDVPVGVHLADQLVLLQALAGGGRFRTLAPSGHARTQLDVIRRFLGRTLAFTRDDDDGFTCC